MPTVVFHPSSLTTSSNHPIQERNKEWIIDFSSKMHTVATTKSTSSAVASTACTANTLSSSKPRTNHVRQVIHHNWWWRIFLCLRVFILVWHQLNGFNGFIKRQLGNVYEAGGEVFGGETMVVDGQGSGGVHPSHHHQPMQMHVVQQQQQQQPPCLVSARLSTSTFRQTGSNEVGIGARGSFKSRDGEAGNRQRGTTGAG